MKSKVDACMFCGCVPCECNKPAPKPAAKKRAAKPAPEPVTTAHEPIPTEPVGIVEPPKKLSFRDAMKAQAALAPPPPPPAPPKPEPKKPAQREIDVPTAMFESAVRALGPLLAPQEREKYRAILTSEPSVAEQRAVWKERRREQETV